MCATTGADLHILCLNPVRAVHDEHDRTAISNGGWFSGSWENGHDNAEASEHDDQSY
jgi:hypothetical protein